MSDVDARLKALFAEDAPPTRDPAFSAAVLARIERRRLAWDMAWQAGAAGLGALVLWAVWPHLQPTLAAGGQGLAPAAACLTLALMVLAVLDRRLAAMFVGEG